MVAAWLDGMKDPDGITTARLDGTAHRLLREHADRDTCIRELHAITTDPRTLGWAAGTALGSHEAIRRHDGDRVARMLLAAGGDPDVCEEQRAAVVRRLRVDQGRPGIGMPS